MNIPVGLNIKELDEWFKKEKWYVWFWLYELDKKLNNNILTYFSENKNLVEDYGNITIYIIRSSNAKKEFNKYQVFLDNINLYLDEDNNNLNWVKEIVSSLSSKDFSRTSKAWRILRYLQQFVYKTEKEDTSWIRNNRNVIVLWDDTLYNWKKNAAFWILDCFFFKRENFVFQPKYNESLVNEKLKWLYAFKELNKKFFEQERNSWIDPTDNDSLYAQYISFLNSKASAKIEGYNVDGLKSVSKLRIDKNLKNKFWVSLKAVENIFKCVKEINKSYNSKQILNVNFIHQIQEIVVNETWEDEKYKKDKTPWYFREFQIWVFDSPNKKIYPSKNWNKTNIAFIAPKYDSVIYLIENLINFYNSNIWKIDDYSLAVLLKLIFVIIHPYGDWNWRTSRLLFEWSLLNTGWIQNWVIFPISYVIQTNKNKYYDALQKTTQPTLYLIDCYENFINQSLVVNYKSDKIFLELDLTPFILFSIDLWKVCFLEAMFEYQYFKYREEILKEFEEKYWILNKDQKFVVMNIIVSKLKEFNWGNKTDKKLDFLTNEQIEYLKTIIEQANNSIQKININNLNGYDIKSLYDDIRK